MLPAYRHICKFLRSRGMNVLSWHVADPDLGGKEAKMSEQEIYDRDISLIKNSDCLIAEVTVPSIGVGYEICRAAGTGMPVLCVHRPEANVSAMLLGNPGKNMRVEQYTGHEHLENIISEFVAFIG